MINNSEQIKRIIHRSKNRGFKEIEEILANFITKNIQNLNQNELNELENLLKIEDQDLYLYIIGIKTIPKHQNNKLIKKIMQEIK